MHEENAPTTQLLARDHQRLTQVAVECLQLRERVIRRAARVQQRRTAVLVTCAAAGLGVALLAMRPLWPELHHRAGEVFGWFGALAPLAVAMTLIAAVAVSLCQRD